MGRFFPAMNHELLDALDELERQRGISRPILVEAIEAGVKALADGAREGGLKI
jgi:hypothetical protein